MGNHPTLCRMIGDYYRACSVYILRIRFSSNVIYIVCVCVCRKNKTDCLNDWCYLSTCRLTGRTLHNVINMGSYNYLGFAENEAESLKTVADTTLQYGVGVCSTRHEIGEFLCLFFCFCLFIVLFGCELKFTLYEILCNHYSAVLYTNYKSLVITEWF